MFSAEFKRRQCLIAEFRAEPWRPFRAWLETLWSTSNRAPGRCGKAQALLDGSSLEAHLAGLWSMKIKLGSEPSLGVNSNFSTNQLWDPPSAHELLAAFGPGAVSWWSPPGKALSPVLQSITHLGAMVEVFCRCDLTSIIS